MLNFELAELKAAIASFESKTHAFKIAIKIEDNKLIMSAIDKKENLLSVTLFADSTLAAQITSTERLMFTKENK